MMPSAMEIAVIVLVSNVFAATTVGTIVLVTRSRCLSILCQLLYKVIIILLRMYRLLFEIV